MNVHRVSRDFSREFFPLWVLTAVVWLLIAFASWLAVSF